MCFPISANAVNTFPKAKPVPIKFDKAFGMFITIIFPQTNPVAIKTTPGSGFRIHLSLPLSCGLESFLGFKKEESEAAADFLSSFSLSEISRDAMKSVEAAQDVFGNK